MHGVFVEWNWTFMSSTRQRKQRSLASGSLSMVSESDCIVGHINNAAQSARDAIAGWDGPFTKLHNILVLLLHAKLFLLFRIRPHSTLHSMVLRKRT